MSRSILTVFCVSAAIISNAAAETYEIEGFSRSAADQKTQVWCWAACVEMLADHMSGKDVADQASIVTRNYGVPVALPAYSWEQIRANLDMLIPNDKGHDWLMQGRAHYSQLTPSQVRNELSAGRPFLIGVNGQSHVVVCYGARIDTDQFGRDVVQAIHIYDPYPGKGDQWLTRTEWPSHTRYRWESSITVSLARSRFVSSTPAIRERIEATTPSVVGTNAMGCSIAAQVKFKGASTPKAVWFRVSGVNPMTQQIIWQDMRLPVAFGSATGQWLPLTVNTGITNPTDTHIMSLEY